MNEALQLWSDEPAAIDLLAFDAIAETVVDAVLDDALDPLALGVSGSWGSGKTTVLRLVEQLLEEQTADGDAAKVLAVRADPWRYDPGVGVRESLIAAVLGALEAEIVETRGAGSSALAFVKRLSRRVDWAKAIRIAAKASIALQLPSFDDLTSLVRAGDGDQTEPRGLDAFREDFAELMSSTDLRHLRRVVVLVDDLDRCLPETVVDALEAIRLFLSVPKMAFVIAADESRVAEAVATRFPAGQGQIGPESPSQLYLHKIVHTTIPLPSLSRFDTEAYLFLLKLQARLDDGAFGAIVDQCSELRLASSSIDALKGLPDLVTTEELAFAARLTPLLYEKLRGNPRRIKRFLNDLSVRQSVAERRGISLDAEVVAKLMVLESLLPDEFARVVQWLASGQLREQMTRLELASGRGQASEPQPGNEAASEADKERASDDRSSDFGDDLLRWAKLPPALARTNLAPYLYLAASVSGIELIDEGLPSRLRDIASNLTSSVRAEQKSVTEADLAGLSAADAIALVQHLAPFARDRPAEQVAAVTGLLRICRACPGSLAAAVQSLGAIPADDLEPATVLLFKADTGFDTVLEQWAGAVSVTAVRKSLTSVRGS